MTAAVVKDITVAIVPLIPRRARVKANMEVIILVRSPTEADIPRKEEERMVERKVMEKGKANIFSEKVPGERVLAVKGREMECMVCGVSPSIISKGPVGETNGDHGGPGHPV